MTPAKKAAPVTAGAQLLRDMEAYLLRFISFTTNDYAFAAALWTVATYLWPHFDAFAYMVITSDTKRSGKTRFSELLSFMAANPRNFSGMTPATLFRSIRDENPTVFIDEAETLASEAASTMRAVLNVGYRKGQTIPRMGKTGVEEWPAYCPKVFILIGDVYDTLRDRSIVFRMRRAEAPTRFVYEPAKLDGNVLGERAKDAVEGQRDAVLRIYAEHPGLTFLPDRDAEIWLPLFAVCAVLDPSRIHELERIAVDMATEKTAEARKHVELRQEGAEQAAEQDEYRRRLVLDLRTVMGKSKIIFTTDALQQLRELSTGPWRRFRGEGLTNMDMAALLKPFGITPKLVRSEGGRKNSRVARGYRVEDVDAAIERNSLK